MVQTRDVDPGTPGPVKGDGNQTITKIETQKKDKNRVSIFLNDAFAFGVHVDVLVEHGLRKGMDLSPEVLDEILHTEEVKKAYIQCVRWLTFSSRTRKELFKKLKEKEYDESTADLALDKLVDHGYINDQRYAENFVESRMHKYGQKRLRLDLRRKGVADETIDQVLSDLLEQEDQYTVALELARKKLAQSQGVDPKKQINRIQGMLLRKGYDYGIVNQVMRELNIRF